MPFKTAYGLSDRELTRFVENSELVKFWLKKFSSRPKEGWLSSSRRDKARILCRFLKWLRIEKDIDLTPRELMERHRKFRLSKDSTVEEMQWLLNLALEHSRDNPDFVGMHAIANRCAMNESEIKSVIEKIVNYYPAWTIGITDDPERRRTEHGNPKVWHHWKADTEAIARNVEEYFIKKV